MKGLIEIVKILGKYKPMALPMVGKIRETSDRVNQFYKGVSRGKIDSDERAAKVILDCSPDDQRYRDLKLDLRNNILNTVFFIDTKKLKIDKRYNRVAIRCHKKWTAARILNSIGAKHAAVELAIQVLKQARKVEMSNVIVDIALYLRFHYGALVGDKQKFEYYNKLYHTYYEIQTWENKAQEYYTELALYYVNSKADKSAIHEKAKKLYEELEPYFYKYKTYKLIYFPGFIKLIIYMSINDFKSSTGVCKEVRGLLNNNSLCPSVGKATFMHQQLICCIQLKRFEEGEALAAQAEKILKSNTYNWFKHQELYFLLSTHTKNYQRAYEILQETTNTKGFQSLDESSTEIWRIYRMYMNYLVMQGKAVAERGDAKHIRLGKFLNEVPRFSQDKRGLNIAILIIQILLYIQLKKYDKAIDRIEAVEKYCTRYLRHGDNFRSNCFIKMILQIPIARFHEAAALRKAEKYHERLLANPIEDVNQAHSIEIIPYEDLWNMVVDSLGRKIR